MGHALMMQEGTTVGSLSLSSNKGKHTELIHRNRRKGRALGDDRMWKYFLITSFPLVKQEARLTGQSEDEIRFGSLRIEVKDNGMKQPSRKMEN